MISTSFAAPKKDESAPDPAVETSPAADDGNNGNGNDPSGSDPSNPGKGKGNNPAPNPPVASVLDLLGVTSSNDPEPTEPEPGSSITPIITPPFTVTNDPFGSTANTADSQGNSNTQVSNSSLPYGSVPLIANDATSIDYLLQKMLADAKASAVINGKPQEITPALRKAYENYARKLAKTLSKLTPEQQDFVFYGVKR